MCPSVQGGPSFVLTLILVDGVVSSISRLEAAFMDHLA